MTALPDRLKKALDEARMLMLGVQVLIGFQFEAALQPGFDRLPQMTRWLSVIDLGLLVCTMACLLAPAMHHQLVEGGRATTGVVRTATRYATIALLPFAAAMGLSFYATAEQLWNRVVGALAAVVAFGSSVVFWYGFGLVGRRRRRARWASGPASEDVVPSKIGDRIDHVLTEARTVLPGAQALLGFQLIGVLTSGFEMLPRSSQHVHFASLVCIALSTILLLTPAAYHRIAEAGQDTEEFHRFASLMLLVATGPLGLGVAGEVFVVARKVSGDVAVSAVAAALVAVLCGALWFGVPVARWARRRSLARPRPDSGQKEA